MFVCFSEHPQIFHILYLNLVAFHQMKSLLSREKLARGNYQSQTKQKKVLPLKVDWITFWNCIFVTILLLLYAWASTVQIELPASPFSVFWMRKYSKKRNTIHCLFEWKHYGLTTNAEGYFCNFYEPYSKISFKILCGSCIVASGTLHF